MNVSIVTVGMNHLSYLKTLLSSLFCSNNSNISFEMIYIDNCSTDGSVDFIKKNYPEVIVIENQTPMGFGENNNKGVFASKGEYIAIINPDIEILDGAIEKLYTFSQKLNEDAIIVPQLLNPDGTLQYSARSFITLKTLLNRIYTRGDDKVSNKSVGSYLKKDMDTSKTQNIEWAIGAAFFMRKSLYARLNGFDTDYFLYMEDEDMCLRSWKNGYSVIYYPSAQMIHNHLRGSFKFGKKTFMHISSMLKFFWKHGLNIKVPLKGLVYKI